VTVELGFRAYDPHELLPHAVARRHGLYERAGVEVRLRDLTYGPDDALQASCGAALLAALRGEGRRVLLVASRAPLFWLVGRGPLGAGARVASYPEGSPPALFARLVVRPGVQLVPARDDAARVGLVLDGSADAAVVSSAVPPAALEAAGLRELRAFSDVLRVPTTGLACAPAAGGEAARVAAAHREALRLLAADPAVAARSLVEDFGHDPASAERRAAALARALSPDGRVPRVEAEAALATVADALGVDPVPVEALYAPEALAS
jgi:hypothetical protein